MKQETIDRIHEITEGWSEEALRQLCDELELLLIEEIA
jgi:hypothetical protein